MQANVHTHIHARKTFAGTHRGDRERGAESRTKGIISLINHNCIDIYVNGRLSESCAMSEQV